MAGKWTDRKVVRNRADTAHKYTVKILHELEIIQEIYGDIVHKNQTYLQAVIEFGILYRDMIERLRTEL